MKPKLYRDNDLCLHACSRRVLFLFLLIARPIPPMFFIALPHPYLHLSDLDHSHILYGHKPRGWGTYGIR